MAYCYYCRARDANQMGINSNLCLDCDNEINHLMENNKLDVKFHKKQLLLNYEDILERLKNLKSEIDSEIDHIKRNIDSAMRSIKDSED